MAGAGGQFQEALDRKYDILQETASSERDLRDAQAAGIANSQASENRLRNSQAGSADASAYATRGSLASENALRGAQATAATGGLASENALRLAQANNANQTASQVAPLASASIDHTLQGEIPLAQAEANNQNANAGLSYSQYGDASPEERLNYKYQMESNNSFAPVKTIGSPGFFDFLGSGLSRDQTAPGYAMGTSNVQPSPQRRTLSAATSTENQEIPALRQPNAPAGQSWQNDRNNSFMIPAGTLDTQHYAAGTSNVQPQKGAPMQAKGKPPQGQMQPPQGQMPPGGMPGGPPQFNPMGAPGQAPNFHAIMAHAMGAMHAAGGATDVMPSRNFPPSAPPVAYPVPTPQPDGGFGTRRPLTAAGGMTSVPPAPGQTITSGSWLGPTGPAMPMPAPMPAPQPTGQDLARRLGMRAAGGATEVRAQSPLPPMGGENNGYDAYTGAYGALTKGSTSGEDQQGAPNLFVGGSHEYSMGTSKVPGKGPSNQDSVPAVLAPGEAVLNHGAATHMGRGAIAALNALGAAKMAQAGMPPATPPTPHGVQMPGRGMPAPAKKSMPMGMPPAKKAMAGGKK